MICVPCKNKNHDECKDLNWCDCQHKPPAQTLGVVGIESAEAVGDIGGA